MEHVFRNWVHNVPSRSSKVVDFGTNQKRVWDFLIVFNSNLCPAKKDILELLFAESHFFPYSTPIPAKISGCTCTRWST